MCKSKINFVYRPAAYDNRIQNVSLMAYCWERTFTFICITTLPVGEQSNCMHNVWLLCALSALCVLTLCHMLFKASRYFRLFSSFSQFKLCSVNDCRNQHCWLGKILVFASNITDGKQCAAQIGVIFTTLCLEQQGQLTTFKEDIILTILSLPLADNVGIICWNSVNVVTECNLGFADMSGTVWKLDDHTVPSGSFTGQRGLVIPCCW